MFDNTGSVAETREVAEFEARTELEAMAEDELTRAERHVRQGQTEKTVVVLEEQIRKLERDNATLEKRLRIRSTSLTRRLERNTMWTKVCCILVVLALVGPTDKVATFVVWLIENYRKAATK